MINETLILPDDYEDEVLHLLEKFRNIAVNTTQREALREQIETELRKKKYISFPGHYKRYYLSRVGTSYLYDVPLYKRGYLSNFRGKRIRIICLYSGCFNYGYWAGIVYNSPQDKIIDKLPKPNRDYIFPGFIDNLETIYRSPRYRVVKVDPSIKILCKSASAGFVETSGWESVLFDGKAGEPVATLRFDPDGTTYAKRLYRWSQISTHATLREAIDLIMRKKFL